MLLIFWMLGICSIFDTRISLDENNIYVRVKNGILTKNYIKRLS